MQVLEKTFKDFKPKVGVNYIIITHPEQDIPSWIMEYKEQLEFTTASFVEKGCMYVVDKSLFKISLPQFEDILPQREQTITEKLLFGEIA